MTSAGSRSCPLASFVPSRALQVQTAEAIALGAHNAIYGELLRENLTSNRALERHNAQPNSIAEDFARFGLDVWIQVDRERDGNGERRKKLWALVTWRNAIAHDNINAKRAKGALEPVTISLSTCRNWRSSLSVLAVSLDRAQPTTAKRWDYPIPGDSFKMMASTRTTPTDSLKVGDRVTSKIPGFNWKGIIIEDLGPLGVDGRQIFLVHVGDEDAGRRFDVPAENLERIAA